jgi:predicted CoA-substrate-specific enzyme activase
VNVHRLRKLFITDGIKLSYAIGLDLGSAAIKAALVEDGRLKRTTKMATAPGQEELAKGLINQLLRQEGLNESNLSCVVATGYGKKLFSGAISTVDEISANAKGLFRLSEGRCRIIVNIGGQDLKAVYLDDQGKVIDFKMNDKCAAGTGRFFEQVARILDTPVESFALKASLATEAVELNSVCVVFAESEIVSLLAKGASPASVLKGFHQSVARRMAGLVGKKNSETLDGLYLDGGPSQNSALAKALEEELMTEVNVLPNPQFTVAYGAALFKA